MAKDKLRTVMNAFFFSQFTYCPLVLMFHNLTLNNRIKKVQKRAPGLVHSESNPIFYEKKQSPRRVL